MQPFVNGKRMLWMYAICVIIKKTRFSNPCDGSLDLSEVLLSTAGALEVGDC